MNRWRRILSFEYMPFRRKLTVLVTTATVTAVVLVTGTAVMTSFVQTRERILEKARFEARLCADASTAAVSFEQWDAAREILAALAPDRGVIGACTYGIDRDERAVWVREGSEGLAVLPQDPGPPGEHLDGRRLVLVNPIGGADAPMGWLRIEYDLTPLYLDLYGQLGLVVLAAFASLGVSLLLTIRFKRGLEQPVRHLADTARQVSSERNYAVRAIRSTHDELGELTDSFNEMLAEIQMRDAALREHGERLEDRIRERTADLERAGIELETRNAALEEAQSQAMLANRAKSEFLANMSHEIRSPMTAILGYADILHDEAQTAELPPRWRDALETIRRNGRHLLNVINDILDLSKLEAGKMTVERVACSPSEIADDVTQLMRVRAGSKGLPLSVEYEPPLPDIIHTDPMRLRQILVNLVGNAVKFTEHGSIRIVVRYEPDADGGPRVAFDVVDTGIGMDATQVRELFEPFTQADASTSRRFGGTGLGLTISRHFARLLGGDITVAGEPGAGCRFTATVAAGAVRAAGMIDDPAAAVEATRRAARARPAGPPAPPAVLRGARVLVAEDTPDNQRLVQYHLETKCRAEVEIVDNGRLAVDRALEMLRRDRPFDVILMDMQMPEMDGYEASRELRRRGYRSPIVALTAHAMRGDRERCLDAGMDDYVAKPIQPAKLYDTLARAVTAGADVESARLDPEATVVPATSWPRAGNGADDGDGNGAERAGRGNGDRAIMDVGSVRQRFQGSSEFLVEMIDLFLVQCGRMMTTLRDAVANADSGGAADAAHALKGSIGNFAAGPAGDAAHRVEELARAGDSDSLESALATLDEEIERLRGRLVELKEEVENEYDGR